MKILVFDTETTGLPIERNPSILETEKWPYIVQLSFILYDDTTNKIEYYSDEIIKLPENVEITEKSITMHKITKDISNQKGVPILDALINFNKNLEIADLVVAHNISFDKRLVMVECIRNKIKQQFTTQGIKKDEHCTMKSNVDFCSIQRINHNNKKFFKYPTLSELYFKLYDTIPKGTHNSMADILICICCFEKKRRNIDLLNDGCEIFKKLYYEYLV